MADRIAGFLKRWRENYYVSHLLSNIAKPLHYPLAQSAFQIQSKVRRNGVTIQLPNGRSMTIGKDSGIGMASLLFWHGIDGYEPDTSRTLRFFFERSATFINVGANCGLYSLLGALWNPDLKVVAFEPVPQIFHGLQKNVLLNHLEGRIRCENLALSSKSGRATFFMPDGEAKDVETTGTLVAESWQARRGSPLLEVETTRFDEYESLHAMKVDLVKIDVEDFEADVLEGMRAVIQRDRPFIVCEILPRPHRNLRTLDLVESLNYQPYWITPVGYIQVPEFDFSRGNCTDFLLSPVSTSDTVIPNPGVLSDLRR